MVSFSMKTQGKEHAQRDNEDSKLSGDPARYGMVLPETRMSKRIEDSAMYDLSASTYDLPN